MIGKSKVVSWYYIKLCFSVKKCSWKLHKTLKSSVVQRHHMVSLSKTVLLLYYFYEKHPRGSGWQCLQKNRDTHKTNMKIMFTFLIACSYCNLSPCLNRQTVSYHAFEHRFYSLKRDEKHPWDVSMKLKVAFLWKIYWYILFQKKKKMCLFKM